MLKFKTATLAKADDTCHQIRVLIAGSTVITENAEVSVEAGDKVQVSTPGGVIGLKVSSAVYFDQGLRGGSGPRGPHYQLEVEQARVQPSTNGDDAR